MSRKNRSKSKSKSNFHMLAPEVVARVINEVRTDRNYIPWVENLAFSDLKQRIFNFFSSEEDMMCYDYDCSNLDFDVSRRKTPSFENFSDMYEAALSLYFEIAQKGDKVVVTRFEPSMFLNDSYDIKEFLSHVYGGYIPNEIFRAWCKQVLSIDEHTVRLSFSDNKLDPDVVRSASRTVSAWWIEFIEWVRDVLEDHAEFWWSDDGIRKFIKRREIMFDDGGKVIGKPLF